MSLNYYIKYDTKYDTIILKSICTKYGSKTEKNPYKCICGKEYRVLKKLKQHIMLNKKGCEINKKTIIYLKSEINKKILKKEKLEKK